MGKVYEDGRERGNKLSAAVTVLISQGPCLRGASSLYDQHSWRTGVYRTANREAGVGAAMPGAVGPHIGGSH